MHFVPFALSSATLQLPALWVAIPHSSVRYPSYRTRLLVVMVSFWAWIIVMGTRPHKEERFMFVVYPLFALLAAAVIREFLTATDSAQVKVRGL